MRESDRMLTRPASGTMIIRMQSATSRPLILIFSRNHLRWFASSSVSRLVDRRESRHAQTLERGASRSSTDVRNDDQFKNRDIGDFNPIFLDLAYRVRRAEIPLLAYNFSK